MAEEEKKRKANYEHYSECALYGWVADDPEIHTSIDSDGDDIGYVILDIMTTASYGNEDRGENGENNTNVRVRLPSNTGDGFDVLVPYDEVYFRGYLATDNIGRLSFYPMVGKIKTIDNTINFDFR